MYYIHCLKTETHFFKRLCIDDIVCPEAYGNLSLYFP